MVFTCSVNWFGVGGASYMNLSGGTNSASSLVDSQLFTQVGYSGSIYNTQNGPADASITPSISVLFDGGSPGTLPAGGIFTIDGYPWRYSASQQSVAQNLLLLLREKRVLWAPIVRATIHPFVIIIIILVLLSVLCNIPGSFKIGVHQELGSHITRAVKRITTIP